MATVFFSYSHQDEALRDKLEEHMALLKRSGEIEAWHDRRITAGNNFGGTISDELERADVILLLVSSSFIASDYCFDVEMRRAMERHEAKEARVIPVILKHCDWHSAPFGKLLAAPRDGRPIVDWPDHDAAFLDVVRQLRAALPRSGGVANTSAIQLVRAGNQPTAASPSPRSSNLRITKVFSQADRDRFSISAFDFILRHFQGSVTELVSRNPEIEGDVRVIDANRFTAVLYRGGKSVSRCKIAMGGMLGGITYSANDSFNDNSFNESLSVGSDEQELHLIPLGLGVGRKPSEKLSPQGAAEYYWSMLMEPLQRRVR